MERSVTTSASAEDTWHLMGDFCDVDDWHPAVATCALKVMEGKLHRVLTLGNGAEFVEKRVAEETGLSYTYTIVSSPLPVEKYVATLSITRGDETNITWSGRFKSDDPGMEGVIAEIYDAGLAAIAAKLGQ